MNSDEDSYTLHTYDRFLATSHHYRFLATSHHYRGKNWKRN